MSEWNKNICWKLLRQRLQPFWKHLKPWISRFRDILTFTNIWVSRPDVISLKTVQSGHLVMMLRAAMVDPLTCTLDLWISARMTTRLSKSQPMGEVLGPITVHSPVSKHTDHSSSTHVRPVGGGNADTSRHKIRTLSEQWHFWWQAPPDRGQHGIASTSNPELQG